MSTTAKTQPWSRGRGFRPKGPFQPARRPGETANASAKENNHTPNSHDNKQTNSPQTINSNQGNDSYVNNKELGSSTTQSNQNGYQSRGNQGNSFQGNSGTKDFRFAGKNQQQAGSSPAPKQVQSNKQNGAGPNQGANKNEPRLLAKYNYKANPSSPLGEPELSLSQGQKVSLLQKHPSNDQWWKVKADDGSVGYVPATYVMLLEAKVSSLPWLADQPKEEDLPEVKPVYKPYVSAYNKPAEKQEGSEEKKPNLNYYCEVCQKQLNGPKPYGAHMASKAHKEEVELAQENGTM